MARSVFALLSNQASQQSLTPYQRTTVQVFTEFIGRPEWAEIRFGFTGKLGAGFVACGNKLVAQTAQAGDQSAGQALSLFLPAHGKAGR